MLLRIRALVYRLRPDVGDGQLFYICMQWPSVFCIAEYTGTSQTGQGLDGTQEQPSPAVLTD